MHGATAVLLDLVGIKGSNNEAEFRAALAALDHAAANAPRRPVIAGDADPVISALRARHPAKPAWLGREVAIAKPSQNGLNMLGTA